LGLSNHFPVLKLDFDPRRRLNPFRACLRWDRRAMHAGLGGTRTADSAPHIVGFRLAMTIRKTCVCSILAVWQAATCFITSALPPDKPCGGPTCSQEVLVSRICTLELEMNTDGPRMQCLAVSYKEQQLIMTIRTPSQMVFATRPRGGGPVSDFCENRFCTGGRRSA